MVENIGTMVMDNHDMSPIAIGDIHGCYNQLKHLLDQLHWTENTTPLWLVGDLINRGPKSIEVLRFCYQHRDRITLVLGNHDMGFLAHYFGALTLKNPKGFNAILAEPESKTWIDWLLTCPFIHHDKTLNSTMVHAGIWPLWSLDDALAAGQSASSTLQAQPEQYLKACFKNPSAPRPHQNFWEQQQFILNVFTRMRYCLADGTLLLHQKGHPNTVSSPAIPWFQVPNRQHWGHLIFGHWAALKGVCAEPDIEAIDSGCVWGEQLTALNLTTRQRLSIPGYHGPLNSSDA